MSTKQRTLIHSSTDNYLNITGKVRVDNVSKDRSPFQKRLDFQKSSMDGHCFQEAPRKEEIQDFDQRQYSHMDRRCEMSHKRLGDQE